MRCYLLFVVVDSASPFYLFLILCHNTLQFFKSSDHFGAQFLPALCLRLEYTLAFLLCNFLLFLTLYFRCLIMFSGKCMHFLGAHITQPVLPQMQSRDKTASSLSQPLLANQMTISVSVSVTSSSKTTSTGTLAVQAPLSDLSCHPEQHHSPSYSSSFSSTEELQWIASA